MSVKVEVECYVGIEAMSDRRGCGWGSRGWK